MIVIPAIDLKNGRCVRLVEGREDSETVYRADPIDVAISYEKAGALVIHVVDLDGAFLGAASPNQTIIKHIAQASGARIEAGGGVRSLVDIEHLMGDVGVNHVILGTVAVENPKLLEEAVKAFGDSIIVGIDARGREVATRGWTQGANVDAIELACRVAGLGVERIIFTDITRDGRLAGPNFEMTREIARASGARVTASGGVSSLDDISRLRDLEGDGVDSVIVGKALYERRFTLEEALAIAGGS